MRGREELVCCTAPVLATLEANLDAERDIGVLAGRTRVTTLKRYVTVLQQWRLWLLEAKQIQHPGRLARSTTSWLGETSFVVKAFQS